MSRAERVQGAIVLVASAAYLSHVFQVFHEGFWTSGMGDWMDPYFINALLEHWHYSFWRVSDPTSPPMFFPATHTLGYSHSLVLYAPFYLPLRLLAHPFLAYNLAIFAVIHVGILCLYVLLRKLGPSFLEALLLTAFFATSANVVGEATSIWSQRASVFLIPPILLMALGSREPGHVKLRLTLAFFSGLCATLLFAHDFYTAQLGVIFVVFVACGALFPRGRGILERIRAFWNDSRLLERAAAAAAVLLAAWSVFVWKWGGGGRRSSRSSAWAPSCGCGAASARSSPSGQQSLPGSTRLPQVPSSGASCSCGSTLARTLNTGSFRKSIS
jgi:hypothetical protein